MKRIWIALGLLALVTAAGVGALYFQISAVQRLANGLDGLEGAVRRRETDVVQRAETFVEDCVQTLDRLECLTPHADHLPLQETVSILPSLLENGNYEQFYTTLARCRLYLHELERAEMPILGNIF